MIKEQEEEESWFRLQKCKMLIISFALKICMRKGVTFVYLLRCRDKVLSPVDVGGVGVLSAHELGHLPGRELGLAHVSEISGQMNGLA